jgi:hypothetical protein
MVLTGQSIWCAVNVSLAFARKMEVFGVSPVSRLFTNGLKLCCYARYTKCFKVSKEHVRVCPWRVPK